VDDVRHPEDALVEVDPVIHPAELDVPDDMVDRDQADAVAGAAVRGERDIAGQIRTGVLGPVDERVHVLAVGPDRRQLDAAVLVLDPLRLGDAAGATLDGFAVGLARVRNEERDVLGRVAVGGGEADDLAVAAEAAREHEPDLALLEDVRGAVADAGLRACVGDPVEAERLLVPVRRLLGVPDPELEVVPALERHEIGAGHGRDLTRRPAAPGHGAWR
jgi:hypothetical protein